MIYDRLAKAKIKHFDNPDPRFLKYGSPHPELTDHTQILSTPEAHINILPNGFRVAT